MLPPPAATPSLTVAFCLRILCFCRLDPEQPLVVNETWQSCWGWFNRDTELLLWVTVRKEGTGPTCALSPPWI